MPLAFPWERPSKTSSRYQPPPAPSHFPASRPGYKIEDRLRGHKRSTSASGSGSGSEHALRVRDLPEVAARKEEQLNSLLRSCYELYNGHKHIKSYYSSGFNISPDPTNDGSSTQESPSPPSSQRRPNRQGFLLPTSGERSPSQTVSPYSRLQFTLDQLLPVTPRKISNATPRQTPPGSTPEHESWTPVSRNTSSPLRKKPTLLKLPLIKQSTSAQLFASPIGPASSPSVPDSPDTPGPLNVKHRRFDTSSPTKSLKPALVWRSSRNTLPRSPGIGLGIQGLEKALPPPASRGPSSGWDKQRSVSTTSQRSAGSKNSSKSGREMPMELRKRSARVDAEKVDSPPAKIPRSAERAKRTDPYSDEAKLFSRNSRLISRRLHGLFNHPEALELLTGEEREQLVTLLPPETGAAGEAQPQPFFLRHNVDWRTAVREFQEDLQAGRYEPKWLAEALNAGSLRKQGAFDSWKDRNFEEFWGQKSIPESLQYPSLAVKIELPEMAKQGCFHIGDVWTYSRLINLSEDAESILVEKDIRLSRIEDDGKILFSIPPGQQKLFAHPLPPLPRKPLPSPQPMSSTSEMEGSSSPVKTIEDAHAEIALFKSMVPHSHEDQDENVKEQKVQQEHQTKKEKDDQKEPATLPPTAEKNEWHVTPATSRRATPAPAEVNEGGAVMFKDAVQVLIAHPDELEAHILDIDGRSSGAGPGTPGTPSWKLFRCRQENRDIGSLWEVRQRLAALRPVNDKALHEPGVRRDHNKLRRIL